MGAPAGHADEATGEDREVSGVPRTGDQVALVRQERRRQWGQPQWPAAPAWHELVIEDAT